MKTRTTLTIFFLLFGLFSYSQKKKKRKKETINTEALVVNTQLIRAGQIMENGTLRGYYEFYSIDKPFAGKQNYRINVFDENANNLNSLKLKESENYDLLNSAYGNEQICFMFLDHDRRRFVYKVYNMEGKLFSNHTARLSEQEYTNLEYHGSTAAQIYSLESGGFVSTSSYFQNIKVSFKLTKFGGNSKKTKRYRYPFKRKYNYPKILGTHKGTIVVSVIAKKALRGKPMFKIIGIDENRLKKTYTKSSEKDGKYIFYPYSMTTSSNLNSFKLSGTYYKIKSNPSKKTTGLAMWELDSVGKILDEKYVAWDSDFKGFLKIKKNSRAKKIGFINIHKVITASDGKTYAIGEGYKKTYNPWSLIPSMFLFPMFCSKFKVSDIVLFEFDKNFNFLSGKQISKRKKTKSRRGFATSNVHRLKNDLSYMFSYNYAQFNEDKNELMFTYSDKPKMLKRKKFKQVLNTCRVTNEGYIFDQLDPNKENASSVKYYVNQYGKVICYSKSKNSDKYSFRVIKVK